MSRSMYSLALIIALASSVFTAGCGGNQENTAVKQDQLNEYLQQNPQPQTAEGANLSE